MSFEALILSVLLILIFIRLIQIHFSLGKITDVLKEIEVELGNLRGSIEDLREDQKRIFLTPWSIDHRRRRRVI